MSLFTEVDMREIQGKAKGSWFSLTNTKFFRSRLPQVGYKVSDTLYYFISSERPGNQGPRRYTIREMDHGVVNTVEGFMEYGTKAKAEARLMYMLKHRGEIA